jgi:hypothetical protein
MISMIAIALPLALNAQSRRNQEDQSSDASRPKAKKKASVPPPRAVAVLEWVPGPPATASAAKNTSGPKLTVSDPNARAKSAIPAATTAAPSQLDPPKEARLVPVSIFYAGAYQDAGVFLSQPTPLALQADTVYDLEVAGDPAGTFTLQSASRRNDAWLAAGNYKPVPPPKPFKPNVHIALGPTADDDSDRPVLKRRHVDADTPASTPASASGPAAASAPKTEGPVGSDDPDRPKLHRAPAAQTAATTSSEPTSTNPAENKPGSATNPKSSDDYLNPEDDKSRPHIRRGTYTEQNPPLPSLLGNPADLRQTVAVSDAAHTDEHPFKHEWNNDDERDRAQKAMQQLAVAQMDAWQKKLPAAKPPASVGRKPGRRMAAPATPDLTAIQFAAFDLSYQDEPTYVFNAQTSDTGLAQIFVTVVARPDIYGNLQVIFSSVTNGAELSLNPRYRLVDAVDANGDGRAELLMESRNLDGRRFLLLDVYRGQAEKVFETGLVP